MDTSCQSSIVLYHPYEISNFPQCSGSSAHISRCERKRPLARVWRADSKWLIKCQFNRQGLRSLQNGRASIPHYPPPSPKSREAESREAEKPMPIMLRPIRRNLVCVYLILPVCHDAIRHATTQRPRGDKFSPHYFPVKASRLPNPQPHNSQLLEGKVKRASWKLIIKNNINYLLSLHLR